MWPDGTIIRKGTGISWSGYSQARCAKIWGSDCKEFKPERWILDNGELYRPASGEWNVFNIGPRSCIGKVIYTMTIDYHVNWFIIQIKKETTSVAEQIINRIIELIMKMMIGERLATLEALTTILILFQRYKITLNKPNRKIDYQVEIALKMKNGLDVFIEK